MALALCCHSCPHAAAVAVAAAAAAVTAQHQELVFHDVENQTKDVAVARLWYYQLSAQSEHSLLDDDAHSKLADLLRHGLEYRSEDPPMVYRISSVRLHGGGRHGQPAVAHQQC